jgi:serine/threonine-protein kinase
VSEAFEGRTLTELLDSAPLPLTQVKRIAEQVASALAYVHARGIFHRDIHPDNILVLNDDQVKVRAMMELGVARILRSGATVNTVSLSRGNLPYYVAPEHIAGQTVDGRVDIYALGAVMYHMVTGRPPFEGADALSVATQHVKQAPQPPSHLNPDLPPDWDALILTALAKNPEQRFQTATLMERAIEALSGAPGQTKSVGVGDATSTRCPRCGHEARGRFCGRCGMRLSVS